MKSTESSQNQVTRKDMLVSVSPLTPTPTDTGLGSKRCRAL